MEAPKVLFGGNMNNCIGLEDGEVCEAVCTEGHIWTGAQKIVCQAGSFYIPGQCMPEAAAVAGEALPTETFPAISVDIEFNIDPEQAGGEKMDFDWAMDNQEILVASIADSLGYPSDHFAIEILRPGGNGPTSQGDDIGGGRLLGSRKDNVTTLRAELTSMKKSALQRRARKLGVNQSALDEALDEDDTKGVIINLIEARTKEKRIDVLLEHIRTASKNAKRRRRLDNHEPAFIVRVTHLLKENQDPKAEIAKMQQKLFNSGGGTNSTNGTSINVQSLLQTTIIKKLKEQGKPVPKSLETATMAAVSPPAYVEEYLVLVPNFVAGAWGTCTNRCGDGTQERKVICPTGLGTCLDKMPLVIQPCANYDECPFDMMCPMGQGQSLGCSTQLSIALGILGCIFCSFFAICMKRLYYKCKPQKEGVHTFHHQNSNVTEAARFKVYYPGKGKEDDYAQQVTADGKIHVIWEIDQNFVESWFDKKKDIEIEGNPGDESMLALPPGPDEEAQFGPASDDEGREADETEAVSEASEDIEPVQRDLPTSQTETNDDETLEGNFIAKAAYQDGERVEYFSYSIENWVMATVKIVIKESNNNNNENNATQPMPVLMYDVILTGGMRHNNVSLDCLRQPLKHGDMVELFSKRNGGEWMPGVIVGTQQASAAMTGYQVHLNDNTEVFQDIPAIRVRLRFPEYAPIWVYFGRRRGWEKKTVHFQATEDGCGAEMVEYKRREMDHHANLHSLRDVKLREMQVEEEATRSSTELRERKRKLKKQETVVQAFENEQQAYGGPNVLDFGLWTQVPVDIPETADITDFVTMPSYLCRLSTSEMDVGRRRVAL